jgi:hypothetical protein
LRFAQRTGDLIADPDDLLKRAVQIDPTFDIGAAKQRKAGVGQLWNQIGILDLQRHARRRANVDLFAVP